MPVNPRTAENPQTLVQPVLCLHQKREPTSVGPCVCTLHESMNPLLIPRLDPGRRGALFIGAVLSPSLTTNRRRRSAAWAGTPNSASSNKQQPARRCRCTPATQSFSWLWQRASLPKASQCTSRVTSGDLRTAARCRTRVLGGTLSGLWRRTLGRRRPAERRDTTGALARCRMAHMGAEAARAAGARAGVGAVRVATVAEAAEGVAVGAVVALPLPHRGATTSSCKVRGGGLLRVQAPGQDRRPSGPWRP